MAGKLDASANWVVDNIIATPQFVFLWTVFYTLWMVGNSTGWLGFDPSPFFKLNDVMSVWATYTLPITAMAARWLGDKQAAVMAHVQALIDHVRRDAAQTRALTEQINKQNAAMLDMAESVRDMLSVMRDQLTDIDEDVDLLREARETEAGE